MNTSVKYFLFVACMATALGGCSTFNKNNFYAEAFDIDLNAYVDQYETSYADGVLEVYDVSPEDDLYVDFVAAHNPITTTSMLFGSGDHFYTPTVDKPLWYVSINGLSPERGYEKYVLYIPDEKKMVFLYADAVGG